MFFLDVALVLLMSILFARLAPGTDLSVLQRIAIGNGLVFAAALGVGSALAAMNRLTPLGMRIGFLSLCVAAGIAWWRRGRGRFSWREFFPAVALPLAVGVPSSYLYAHYYPVNGPIYFSYLADGAFIDDPSLQYPQQFNYGNVYVLPFMFLKHALAFLTLLLSSGDHFQYYVRDHAVVAWLTYVGVVLGAYAWSRCYMRTAPALLVGAIWISSALAHKLVSIRGETMGWIPAFAFLTLFAKSCQSESSPAETWGRRVIVAMLALATVFTHGVTALVALAFAAGTWVFHVVGGLGSRRWAQVRNAGAIAGAAVGMLAVVYLTAHVIPTWPGESEMFEIYGEKPLAGTPDAGVAFTMLLAGQEMRNVPAVRDAPPYVPLSENFDVSITNPVQDPFGRGPGIIRAQSLKYMGYILSLFCLLWLARYRRPIADFTFLASLVSVFLVLAAYSVYLNYQSVTLYPWQIVPRRLVPYSHAAVAAALTVSTMLLAEDLAQRLRATKVLLLAAVLAAWLCCSAYVIRPDIAGWPRRPDSTFLSPHFMEAMRYLASQAKQGELAIANFQTINQLFYLTGLHFITEGGGPYQVYRLIRRSSESIGELNEYFRTGNESYLTTHKIRFILICKTEFPPGNTNPLWREFRMQASPLVAMVFKNPGYEIYQVLP